MFDPFNIEAPGQSLPGMAYVSPGEVVMGTDGPNPDPTPMSHFIPSGSFGGRSVGRGVVIPHAKGGGGTSWGYNPHKPPHRLVTVDSHLPGCAVQLDLDKISPDNSEQAYAAGASFATTVMAQPPAQIQGVATTVAEAPRLAAYAAVQHLARHGARPDGDVAGLLGVTVPGQLRPAAPPVVVAPQPAAAGKAAAASFRPAVVAAPVAPVVVVAAQAPPQPAGPTIPAAPSPLARFQQAAPVVVAPAQVVAQPVIAAGPPLEEVTFDFGEKVGKFPAQYHRVVRTPGGLVLAWDTRWPHAKPYSPEHLADRFAVQVAGDPQAHLVMSLGDSFTFEFEGFRFFFLGVIESAQA